MTDENTLPESMDLRPVLPFRTEFEHWVRRARGEHVDPQHPVDELLAEHHMLDAALAAMEVESHRLSRRQVLRTEAWADIVDFVGNFIHLVHRRKESQALFGAFAEASNGDHDKILEQTEREHQRAARLTMELMDGVNEGDWEKVLRTAQLYLAFARAHLRHEEEFIFDVVRGALGPTQTTQVRADFDRLEAFGLGERDRLYYLQLVQRLCHSAGLDATLDVA